MLKNGGVWYTSGTLSVCVHTGGFVKRFGQCASAIRIGWLHQDVLFGRKWRSRRLNVWADSGNSGRNRGRMRALSITRLLWEKRDRESEFLLCVFVFLSQFTRLQFQQKQELANIFHQIKQLDLSQLTRSPYQLNKKKPERRAVSHSQLTTANIKEQAGWMAKKLAIQLHQPGLFSVKQAN